MLHVIVIVVVVGGVIPLTTGAVGGLEGALEPAGDTGPNIPDTAFGAVPFVAVAVK
jgi:hypothetical protein